MQPLDTRQQRGLAGTVRDEQAEDLAGLNCQVNLLRRAGGAPGNTPTLGSTG